LGNIEYDQRKIEDKNLNLYLTRIDKKLDLILDLLKHHPTTSNYSSSIDTTFLDNFPINDVETLKNVDEMFKKDQEYLTKLVIKQNTYILLFNNNKIIYFILF